MVKGNMIDRAKDKGQILNRTNQGRLEEERELKRKEKELNSKL